ncbi:MAG: hypothetical protein J6Y62_07045, partial [Clostridia bacterium]|nr:hypothetical protein [Clostridia bacterium]
SLSKGIEWLERKGFERDNRGFYRKIAIINGQTFEITAHGERVSQDTADWSVMAWKSHGDFMYKVFWNRSKDYQGLLQQALEKAEQVSKLEGDELMEELEKDKGLEPWTE